MYVSIHEVGVCEVNSNGDDLLSLRLRPCVVAADPPIHSSMPAEDLVVLWDPSTSANNAESLVTFGVIGFPVVVSTFIVSRGSLRLTSFADPSII